MARYRRVNIDGKSLFKTETRKLAAATYPGTFAVINGDDEFAQSTAVTGRMYIIDCAHHEGLGIEDQIPADHSAIGNYLEEGREFAVRMAAGTYTKDQAVTVSSGGLAIPVPTAAGRGLVYFYAGSGHDPLVRAEMPSAHTNQLSKLVHDVGPVAFRWPHRCSVREPNHCDRYADPSNAAAEWCMGTSGADARYLSFPSLHCPHDRIFRREP